MTDSKNLADELENILNELTPENIDQLSEEQLLSYRQKLNVYGRVIQGSDHYLTFSYTNLSEKYIEKLMLTGLIGYLNTACDEWNLPDGMPRLSVYDYVKNPSKLDKLTEGWGNTPDIVKNIEDNKKWMEKRVIVKEFLEDMFQYNPDNHIRSAYKPSPRDIARGVIDTPAANLAISELSKKDAEFREQMYEYDRVQKLIAMKEKSDETIDSALANLVSKKLVIPDQHYKTMDYSTWTAEDKNLLSTVCGMIPPADIFGKFRNYYESNYDRIREAVLHLYCDKPDFDIAICPHDWHETVDEVDEFQKKHRGEVIAEILKADSGKWNFHAPFAKVRDSMKFFNENTVVLEEITKQIESDSKLGGELMKNRIKQQKKKNIEDAGEDAEIFTQWRKNNTVLKDMNAITISKDDLLPDDTPEDGICVPVFRIKDGKMDKTHFFTKAEAPLEQENNGMPSSSS